MAYRRRFYRRRRRAAGKVRTVNGRTARFVKAPTYKNLSYKGNERSGFLHELKFVLTVPVSWTFDNKNLDSNFAFMYVNCLDLLYRQPDFLKFIQQYEDWAPYSLNVSASSPIALSGNCLLTGHIKDFPYVGFDPADINNAAATGYPLKSGFMYPVNSVRIANKGGQVYTSASGNLFNTFFASWSTSKKLWNANIPYGGRYCKYYATSLQKASATNILGDTSVDAQILNNYNVIEKPDDHNSFMIDPASGYTACRSYFVIDNKSGDIVQNASDGVTSLVANYKANDYYKRNDTIDQAVLLYSQQRDAKGQFNPFYYLMIDFNQCKSVLTAADHLSQINLTFKWYIYFKNERTNYFGTGGAVIADKPKVIDIPENVMQQGNNQAAQQQLLDQAGPLLLQSQRPVDILAQYSFLKYSEYFLALSQDIPYYAQGRNAFVIDESCYNPSTGNYEFEGYFDLLPPSPSNTAVQNIYESDQLCQDQKIITHWASDEYQSSDLAGQSRLLKVNQSNCYPLGREVIDSRGTVLAPLTWSDYPGYYHSGTATSDYTSRGNYGCWEFVCNGSQPPFDSQDHVIEALRSVDFNSFIQNTFFRVIEQEYAEVFYPFVLSTVAAPFKVVNFSGDSRRNPNQQWFDLVNNEILSEYVTQAKVPSLIFIPFADTGFKGESDLVPASVYLYFDILVVIPKDTVVVGAMSYYQQLLDAVSGTFDITYNQYIYGVVGSLSEHPGFGGYGWKGNPYTYLGNFLVSSIKDTASKVWRKIKGFFKRAWTSFKKILPVVSKVAQTTLPIIGGPAGAVAGKIISGVSSVVTDITPNLLTTTKELGLNATQSLAPSMKFTFTPGIAWLPDNNPVTLNNLLFEDRKDAQFEMTPTPISPGMFASPQYLGATQRFKYSAKDFHSSMTARFVRSATGNSSTIPENNVFQTRLKVTFVYPKPSPDFVLPTIYCGLSGANVYTEQQQVVQD